MDFFFSRGRYSANHRMRLSIAISYGADSPHYCIDLCFLVLRIKLGPSHMVNGHNAISLSNNPSDF